MRLLNCKLICLMQIGDIIVDKIDTGLKGYQNGSRLMEQTRSRNFSTNKIIELLHNQLMRKNRALIEWYSHSQVGLIYKVKQYNIKSPSKNPYEYNNINDLSLNHLFFGTSPYKPWDYTRDDKFKSDNI